MNFSPFSFLQQASVITPSVGPVTTNLSLWYDAGNTSSYPGTGTSWSNLQPTTLTSTLNNGAIYSTNNGGTIVFDGTNDFTSGPNNAIFDFGTGDFTLEVWAKVIGNSSANNSGTRDATLIGCFSNGGAVPSAWEIQINGTASTTGTGLLFQRYVSGVAQNITLSYSFTQGVFYQIGITRTGGTTKFFINGVEYNGSTNITGAVNSGGYQLYVASLQYAGYLQYLNGSIGIVRIYKGLALSTAQILQNYNANSNRI